IIDDEADGPDDDDQDGDDTDATDPDDDGEGEEETVIGFADETDDEDEDEDSDGGNSVIRNLRAQLKEKTKRLRELETAAPTPAKIEVGPKPTLADCNYDEEAYEEQLDKWKADSAKAEEQTAAIEEENRRAQESWTN